MIYLYRESNLVLYHLKVDTLRFRHCFDIFAVFVIVLAPGFELMVTIFCFVLGLDLHYYYRHRASVKAERYELRKNTYKL